jgi:hypothetical protein
MFGMTIPLSIDSVRILAITGKQGKRPCLWEGHPSTPEHEIEAAIDSDLRVRRWLSKHHLIKNGVATLSFNIELYSGGRRVETLEAKDISLFIRQVKRKPRATSEEVVIKSISVLESTIKNLGERLDMNWKTLTEQLEQRDTVIGMLVQRGLNPPAPPKAAEPPSAPPDSIDNLFDKGGKLIQFMNMVKAVKGSD